MTDDITVSNCLKNACQMSIFQVSKNKILRKLLAKFILTSDNLITLS